MGMYDDDILVENLWDRNEIQFARLICEIVATSDVMNIYELCVVMDLDLDEVNELFERANEVWEQAKEDITGIRT